MELSTSSLIALNVILLNIKSSLILCRADVTVALLLSALFGILVVSSLVTLYFRHFWLCLLILCISIFIPLRLRNSRKSLARKRERRMLLPLSMWIWASKYATKSLASIIMLWYGSLFSLFITNMSIEQLLRKFFHM